MSLVRRSNRTRDEADTGSGLFVPHRSLSRSPMPCIKNHSLCVRGSWSVAPEVDHHVQERPMTCRDASGSHKKSWLFIANGGKEVTGGGQMDPAKVFQWQPEIQYTRKEWSTLGNGCMLYPLSAPRPEMATLMRMNASAGRILQDW